MKKDKREKLLRKPLKRRSYGAILLKRLIPCLIVCGALFPLAIWAAGQIYIATMHEGNLTNQYFTDEQLRDEYDLYNGDNYEQRIFHSLYVKSGDSFGINETAYEVYDSDTGELLLRTEHKGIAQVKTDNEMTKSPVYYYCDRKYLGDVYDKYLDIMANKDKNAQISMGFEDIYISDDGTFLPGKGSINTLSPERSEVVLEDEYTDDTSFSFDLTPDNTTGLTHLECGMNRTYAGLYGISPDSNAFRILDDKLPFMTATNHSSLFGEFDYGCAYSIIRDKVLLPNGKSYMICACYYDDGSAYCIKYAVMFGSAITLITVIIALLTAYRTYMKEQAHFAMEDYRRDMTNTMAHDLKTPLMAISGAAENMKNITDEEKRMHYADMILSNVDYMNGLIGSVLELAKVEQITRTKKETVDLKTITEETAGKYTDVLKEKNVSLNISGSGTVKADSSLMRQVIENLFSNAVKYSVEGNSIDIEISSKSYTISNQSRELTNKTADQLWQPFVKGDNSRSEKLGSGLGLSIVKNICDSEGFKTDLTMNDGKFTVTITF
ncbi:Histidine kinase-, DNA gyrase B-, and HSP90-like ATPase [Ruminococcus sp. YE71]|uniref:sensor histidine kinase n=1 Tax=unclassified Ruminococcus TaxID=2608920 RepID=UPI000885D5F7|nr:MULTISPECIES: HAMP domain-containing sensor histidine kinase [unclassified Ruminococcus]SDA20775.1 Histidine kinase-, DNA gyrase B-, and HSP90-like ATPase [Ruminococcus sp. YE78]SFW33656.1 Histidine kinase-, DNA gyrase B-, and HSP90-like ATPase [Ruminococcus sp. YE71]